MDALGNAAHFFTLTPADLDPNLSDDPSGLYRDTVSALLDAVARAFHGPAYAVAEVGKGRPGCRGKLHVHVMAHRDDGPAHIKRDTQRCTAVYDVFGLYRYLAKPPERYSLEAELDATAARVMSRSGRLPNTRRHLLTPARLAWVASTYCPKNQTPPDTPHTAPQTPHTAAAGTQATPTPAPRPRPLRRSLSHHRTPATTAPAPHSERDRRGSSETVRRPAPRSRGPPASTSTAFNLSPFRQNGTQT